MEILKNSIIETSRYVSGCSSDYPFCRIPAIVADDKGNMYICYECRQDSDWSVIDIALRVSRDCGNTWSDRQIIVSSKGRNACNNPTLLIDGKHLILIYCENYKRVFTTVSEDLGVTWSKPTELTETFDDYYWSCVAIGPGHGTVGADGAYYVPFWFAFNQQDMFAHHPSKAGILCSRDKGLSWSISAVFEDMLVDPSEISVALLSNGSILANIRNENSEKCRAFSFFSCNDAAWSAPVLRTDLPDPTCFGGLCSENNALLSVNCRHKSKRENLCVSVSHDDGKTWKSYFLDAIGGYADICYNKITDTAFVLYETEQCRYMRIAEVKI